MKTHIRSKLCRKPRLRNHKFAGPKPIPKPIPNRYPTHWPPCRIQPAALQLSLELPKCTFCTTFVLKSCDFRFGAAKMYFVYSTILHLLALKSCDFRAGAAKVYCAYYCNVATFQLNQPKCTLCATLVLKSCDFPAGAGSWQSVLRTLHLYGKVVTFELELPKHGKPMQRRNPILIDTRA